MKNITKNKADMHRTAHAAGHKNHPKVTHPGEPVPLDLMENPNGAKARQWKNTGMPSDFWL